MSTIPGMITIEEAAAVLKKSAVQVWRYVDRGLLKSTKVSGIYLIPERELKHFVPPPVGNPAFRQQKKAPRKKN